MAGSFQEGFSPVQSGQSPSLNVDLATLSTIIAGVVAQVARQVMVVGDASDANAVTNVARGPTTGNEYAFTVRLAPSADMQALLQSMEATRLEIQNLISIFGGAPLTQQPTINLS